MERQNYIDQINDLKASKKRLIEMIDVLKQTLESVTASNKRNEELVVKLTAQVDQLQKMIKNLEDKNCPQTYWYKEMDSLTDDLTYHREGGAPMADVWRLMSDTLLIERIKFDNWY